jgi:hypothetical protein
MTIPCLAVNGLSLSASGVVFPLQRRKRLKQVSILKVDETEIDLTD